MRISGVKPCPSINQSWRAQTEHSQNTFPNRAMRLSQTTYNLAIVWRKKSQLLWNSNVGNLNRVLVNRKNLWNKSEDLNQLKFSGKLFISESIYHENHQLAYKCHQLKIAGKIHSTWFSNNAVNAKLSERSNPVKIFHIIDIENLLGFGNLDNFISNNSF